MVCSKKGQICTGAYDKHALEEVHGTAYTQNGNLTLRHDHDAVSFFRLGSTSTIHAPRGIACDDKGNFYVVDCKGKRVHVFAPNGEALGHWRADLHVDWLCHMYGINDRTLTVLH